MPSNKQAFVSVIVPVYRGRDLFASLLNDIRNQTLQELEIILVDDCGGDGTFDIAEAAASDDSRIICLHNPGNRGPGFSRNQGIRAATGKYLAFADADDILPPDFYKLLYTKAEETGAKVVKGRRAAKTEDGTIVPSSTNDTIRKGLSRARSMLNLFTFEHTTALYDTELVKETGALNADARQDEDTTFLCMLMSRVSPQQFALEDRALYLYRKVDSSLTRHLSAEYGAESVKSLQAKLAHLATLPDSDEVALYAAKLFEERVSWRLQRIIRIPGITQDIPDSYCTAIRSALRSYLESGHRLAYAGTSTTRVAAGKSAVEIANSPENTPTRQTLPKITAPRHPSTPKEKNVAILNFAGGANYGANLTAYALAKAVEKEGFHPYIVNRRFLYYPALDTDGRFLRFGEKYLKWTVPCYGREHYKLLNRHFDTFIVGSDQVWAYQPQWYSRPVQLRDIFDLEFTAPAKRRIAMAASFGENNYATAPRDFCSARAAALQCFAAVSVREGSGVDICRDYLQTHAKHVLDPVFLLSAEEWGQLADEAKLPLSHPYVATCCLHTPLVPVMERIKLAYALQRGWSSMDTMQGSMQDWLNIIRGSELVVTDSFHVGCFAIIFRRPVILLVNDARGADRMPSLLAQLGVQTPLYSQEKLLNETEAAIASMLALPSECTNYSHGEMEAVRQKTADFLHRALHVPLPAGAAEVPVSRALLRQERGNIRMPIYKMLLRTLPRFIYHRLRAVIQKSYLQRSGQEKQACLQAYIRLRDF